MEKILYTEVRNLGDGIKEITVLYESDNKFYVSYKKEAPSSGVRLYRRANMSDHAKYTEALLESATRLSTH